MSDAMEQLVELYGQDPSEVGAVDGAEDDFGDLILDTVALLGHNQEDFSDEGWDHIQDVAAASRATTMEGWIALMEAAICVALG